MKKILVLLLIFVLSFSIIGCGSDDDSTQAGDENPPVAGDGANEEQDGDADSDEDVTFGDEVLNVDDLYMSDEDEAYERPMADFGLKADKNFSMSSTLEKVSYKDFAGIPDVIENSVIAATADVFGKAFATSGEYEEYPGDELDKLSYVIAMEDNDTEKCYMEVGAYHDSVENKNYQYSILTSNSYYDTSRETVKEAIAVIENAFGISVSEKKVISVLEDVVKEAEVMEGYSAAYDYAEVKGKDYTEDVWFGIEASMMEDNRTCWYLSIERERLYN